MRHEPVTREDKAMAVSFPAPESAAKGRLELASGESTARRAWLFGVGSALRRGYERVYSAIFDPDGDCTRF
jgi:hypothetical protein